ncbi:MAG: efflux RND transporter periplasmic adaptor subunit [Desulfobulbaceae bacterium]|nr:efflux RND transporter periplasmic adaptor subunit [Desulfobulbaceae bacterium]
MSSKKKTTYLIVATIFILVGILGYGRYAAFQEQKNTIAVVESRKPVVQVRAITRQNLTAWTFAEGTVLALNREYVNSDAVGLISELGSINGEELREGMRVQGSTNSKKGTLLLRIDSKILEAEQLGFEAEYSQAKTAMKQAKRDLDRSRTLFKKKIGAVVDLEQSETSYKAAQARVRAAKSQLDRNKLLIEKTEVRASFDGIIKRVNTRVGDFNNGPATYATAKDRESNALMVVIDTTHLEAILNIPLWESPAVQPGQRVFLANSSYELLQAAKNGFTKGSFAVGEVYAESPSISLDKRSIEVKARTTKGAENLRDGSYIVAWIETNVLTDVLTVPEMAVLGKEETPSVYVYNPETSRVEERPITIGEYGLGLVEVIDGVKDGELVVVDGAYTITNGSPVRAIGETDE